MATNKSIEIVKSLIEYIENNTKESITLDSIESHINMSRNHLHRLFKAVTNKKLIDYVRNRKLSCSIHDLLFTDSKIIDIALEYGFEYEQSYIRSFSRAFKISPKKFRKEKVLLQIEDKIDVNTLYPIGEYGFLLEPIIMIRPSFSVIGMEHIIYFKDNVEHYAANKAYFEFGDMHRQKIKNIKFPGICIGIAQYKEGVTDHKRYIACVEVSDMRDIPPGMISLEIPTHKYAVFKFIFLHNVRETTIEDIKDLQYRFNEWLTSSSYKMADHFTIESANIEVLDENYCEVEFHFPIVHKETPSEGNRLLFPIQEL